MGALSGARSSARATVRRSDDEFEILLTHPHQNNLFQFAKNINDLENFIEVSRITVTAVSMLSEYQ